MKGKHTITAGLNFRLSQNDLLLHQCLSLYKYGATELID